MLDVTRAQVRADAQALLTAVRSRLDQETGDDATSDEFHEGFVAALTNVIAHPAAVRLSALLAGEGTAQPDPSGADLLALAHGHRNTGCLGCGGDVAGVGVTHLTYAYERCDCDKADYTHLTERIWHLTCLTSLAPTIEAAELLDDAAHVLDRYKLGKPTAERIRAFVASRASGEGTAPPPPQVVTATYTNWQGETAERRFVPVSLWWGVTEWHPRSGWVLDAWDVDRQAVRSFALSGFAHEVIALGTAPQVPAEEGQP